MCIRDRGRTDVGEPGIGEVGDEQGDGEADSAREAVDQGLDEVRAVLNVQQGHAAVSYTHLLYPHNFPNHLGPQQYLPDLLKGTVYYHYGDNKVEQAARHYWDAIKGGSDGNSGR